MRTFDVIVVGSGSGGEIVDAAVSHGLSVAWVDKGPLGGTCLNVGCIPSKTIIFPADRIMEIQDSKKLGITAEIKDIDFFAIMERIRQPIQESQESMHHGIETTENVAYFKGEGHFISDYTMEILGEKIQAKKIFIASGARPSIPPVKGLDTVAYLTNENVFNIREKPESLAIIGGGYIAVEFAHFFAAVETKVTIFQRANRLIPNAEPEVSALLKKQLEKRMRIYLGTEVLEVKKQGDSIHVIGKDRRDGKEISASAQQIMIATGRKSNADILKVENTGVKTDARGYILVNEYLETSKKNIWALGDAIGKAMFKHVANEEASVAWRNAFHEHKAKMEYNAIPYAIFTSPQIASVGMIESEARKDHKILVGFARYRDVAKGMAMMEQEGFAKAIVDKQTGKIIGFHIIGPSASILIQEVTNAMALGGDIALIAHGLHIHPALPELVLRTLGSLQEVP
jgi:mycothione reductase